MVPSARFWTSLKYMMRVPERDRSSYIVPSWIIEACWRKMKLRQLPCRNRWGWGRACPHSSYYCNKNQHATRKEGFLFQCTVNSYPLTVTCTFNFISLSGARPVNWSLPCSCRFQYDGTNFAGNNNCVAANWLSFDRCGQVCLCIDPIRGCWSGHAVCFHESRHRCLEMGNLAERSRSVKHVPNSLA